MKLKAERIQFGMSMFCTKCHTMFARTEDGKKKCRRCEPKYFKQPEKKRGVDTRW